MNDKKEPAFFEFEAPNTDLNNLEFNIETNYQIPEFEIKSFEFEPPETIPEFNIENNDEKLSLETIEKNLANEFIEKENISQNFQIPESKNMEYENIFENAISEIKEKIKPKPQKISFLKKISFKAPFQNK